MGRKLNISTPTVINTELVPLTTSFWLEPNGLTEQWYYENTNVFSPDRQITPLVITPRISAVDTDTNTSYTPVINNVQWVVQWWNGTQWVESVITNNNDSFDNDYVIDGNTLIVHKNNADPTHSINIRCTATYRDPRDAGATYTAQESLSLTTNRDATVISPKIDVLSEPSVTFNPLKSQTSLVEFKGVADWGNVPSKNEGSIAAMKAQVGGQEEIMPANTQEVVNTAPPTLTIRYGEGSGSTLQEDQTFMSRPTANGEVSVIPQNIAFVEKIKGNILVVDDNPDNGVFAFVKMTGVKTTGGQGSSAWEALANIPITSLKGKLNGEGESVTIFPDGIKKIENTFDEIYYDNGILKAVKRVESIALGSLTFTKAGGAFYTSVLNDTFYRADIFLCGYNNTHISIVPQEYDCTINANKRFLVKDSRFSTGELLEAHFQEINAQLYYELATPEVYHIDFMPRGSFEWYGVKNGAEVKIDTLPCYVSGQNTDTLTIDAMYDEQIPIILRIKEYSWSEAPYPPKVYRSVVWRVPTIDSIVVSENGEAVRSNSGSFTFDTVVNVLGEALSDEKKAQHLRFNWKSRKANATPQFGMTDRGWGQKVTIKASDLKNYKSSSIVTNDVYVLGAYEEVLLSNESVTLNGEKVYAREL